MPVSETQVLHRLAERIKELRGQKGWSQEDLADQASMQRSYIADLERGYRNPSIRTVVKIANALKVTVRDLF